jgi:O-antigen/teichoic acid export membrane protein
VAYAGLLLAGLLLGYDDTLRRLLPLAGISLFIDVLGTMVHNQLLARDQMVIPSIIGVVHMFLLILLAGSAVMGGMGLPGLYWATITASSLRAIAYWLALIRAGVWTIWPLDRAIMARLLVNGAPLALNALMVTTYQHVDKIVMTAMIGEENTALLVAAFIIVTGMVELLNITVLVAVLPMMSRQHGAGEMEAFNFLVEKISFLTLVLSVPIAVVISVLASTLVGILFSPKYTSTTDVLQVLIWYGVLSMFTNVFGQVLMIQNRQVRLLLARVGGLAINVPLLLLLLPRIGVTGAAVGSVVAETVVAMVLVSQWGGAAEYLQRVGPRLVRLAAAGLAMFGVMLILRAVSDNASGSASPMMPVLALLAGGLVYGALIGLLGVIAPDDRGFIRQVLISMPGGAFVARFWK